MIIQGGSIGGMNKVRCLVINKVKEGVFDAVVIDRRYIDNEDAVREIANYVRNASISPVTKPCRMEMAGNRVYVTFTGDPEYCVVNWLFKFSISLYYIRDMANEHKEKCIAFYIPDGLDNDKLTEMRNEISKVFGVEAEEIIVED